jgi:hypothetical protein
LEKEEFVWVGSKIVAFFEELGGDIVVDFTSHDIEYAFIFSLSFVSKVFPS